MSCKIPAGAIQQPEENVGHNKQGDKDRSISYLWDFDALQIAADALVKGDEIVTGWVFSSCSLRRVAGGLGILTIDCIPKSATGGEEGGTSEVQPLKDIWSIRGVRNDVSIMAYCGDGENEPNRAMIEAWMKEPDGKLAKMHQFRRPDGEIEQLTTDAATMDLVAKIEKGIESVIRFYPVVTRKRVYDNCPPACLEHLGFIDDPPAPGTTTAPPAVQASESENEDEDDEETTSNQMAPNGLADIISQYQWLKVQDDADERDDGKWSRIESWWGIKKADDQDGAPWDADLYGNNRWSMPHNHQVDTTNT